MFRSWRVILSVKRYKKSMLTSFSNVFSKATLNIFHRVHISLYFLTFLAYAVKIHLTPYLMWGMLDRRSRRKFNPIPIDLCIQHKGRISLHNLVNNSFEVYSILRIISVKRSCPSSDKGCSNTRRSWPGSDTDIGLFQVIKLDMPKSRYIIIYPQPYLCVLSLRRKLQTTETTNEYFASTLFWPRAKYG